MAYKRKTAEERAKEINDLMSGMEQQIVTYFRSEESLKEYLDFMGKFYNYSTNNSILIDRQFHGAQAVGSFSFWKSKGFFVQKGEKGIKILVPKMVTYFERNGKQVQLKYATKKEKEQIEKKQIPSFKRTFFDIGHVFDVSQTNATAKDLPQIFPNRWLEGSIENYQAMYKALEQVAKTNGVKIVEPYNELGVAKGVSYTKLKEVALNPRNSELQNVKTLVHELAHAVLHTAETHQNYTSQEKEFQAEMVAYTVSSYFGLDTSEYSLPYLHHWTEGKELKDQQQLLKEVRDTSHDFIQTLEEELVKDRDLATVKEQDKEAVADRGDDLQPIDSHTLRISSFGDRTDRAKEEIAQLILTNGMTGKEHVTSICANDIEKGELQPYYVYVNLPAKQGLNQANDYETALADSVVDTPLFEIIQPNEAIEKAIHDYANGSIDEFNLEIPKENQKMDVHEWVVNEELSNLLLKSDHGLLEKNDIINFGKLTRGSDLGVEGLLKEKLGHSFHQTLDTTRVEQTEWPFVKATLDSFQIQTDLLPKNKSPVKADRESELAR
ncbi:hypothetical protein BEP19_16875 [Ammoniphilus oxalaticus]|uniref:Uncharacterized protein n=1 Tax=Ammoniphilus oxalaticus TaxID=66863 RepID=A0A419SQ40_9BACL|nr:ImmA/IrrE family metallo-endopeptidase [Ammoniphilus oxalaticus]RKD26510.1 hypothetical protein BEP19_16875 [Ammoniphilus oxalaticus]